MGLMDKVRQTVSQISFITMLVLLPTSTWASGMAAAGALSMAACGIGAAGNAAMLGGVDQPRCANTEDPEHKWYCVRTLMDAAQIATLGSCLMQSGQSKADSQSSAFDPSQFGMGDFSIPDINFPNDNDSTTPGSLSDLNGIGDLIGIANDPALKAALQSMADRGYDINGKEQTVKLPDGTEIPFSEINTPGGMAAAGVSGDSPGLAETRAKEKELAAKMEEAAYKVSAMEAGAGSGFSGYDKESDSSFSYKPTDFSKLFGQIGAKGRKPSSVSGMKVLYKGDPIGVKEDNIFEMIHRRYRILRKQGAFIE